MRVALAVALLLLAGCSYYNGMYKVDHLAGQARSAEREGRTFTATSLWGQVSVKAESALVRHPRSGWADRARLLQGTALARLRDCRGALSPLQVVMTGPDPVLAEEATVLVGSCQITLGNPAAAATAFARLTGSRDSVRRSQALFYHGQALRMGGEYAIALAELERSSVPRARGERAAALAGLGRVAEAGAIAESLLAQRDTLVPWDSLLAGLARHDPPAAADLVESIARADSMPAGFRARLLLADARRLAQSDPAAAEARLRQVEVLGQGLPIVSEARYVGLVARLARMDSLPQLAAEFEAVADEDAASGPFFARTAMLGSIARRALLITDSSPAGSPAGDLRLFVAAELIRDSLLAPRLAARQFGRLATDWPDSPFAPKALLARIALDTVLADSLREVLATQYAGSPYLLQVQGGDPPAFRALEDSLRRFVLSFRLEGPRPTPVGRPRPPSRPTPSPQPATPKTPVDQ
ncbi:MAG: hypothetical protein SGJ01_08680 [Gemmatimonadota bacterium]|nr:hypothetical protein [Gemmatimonadota bacterium]